MLNRVLMKGIVGLAIAFASVTSFAASIEGYWKSIDDRTGEQQSIVEIRKAADGTFHGKILYRYPVPGGVALTHCTKCPPPYTNQPLLGLEILSGFKEDPDKRNAYVDGKVLEAKSGKIYKGKANLSADGKRLRLRGYVGISALGRTQVWIRTDSPNP
ncbi:MULTISPECIES: DUF2147 domain-containing protein [unclassified Acinetobacter]|uniref:DUF2147 domain-containing protein n=1 Tax=unclassified Acinetobacter TaxID=196816 RepID=UPI0002CDA87E|nr:MULTISPECIES: DUF2147 domain-containing protein [unclassified Acinetobacter]ENW81581.1 hypothetical protein F908_01941 [Acinetobacter sp. NIPH 284]NWK82159.1 DUF2147 domain-containing protein [Acinetobacter sp. SwsAc4]